VFQPIVTVYAYIVKVSHDHVLLLRRCNNLMHMWHHVTNHLIISDDKDSNSENRIKLCVRDSVPIFDGSDPCKIGCYFDDLEFLFLRHHVSDDQEKKHTAVRYTSWALEKLWQSMPTFSEHARSYEDFKVEVLALYLEVNVEHKYTLAGLAQLVSDHACTLVCSEQELGEFYHVCLLASCFLIAKGCLSTQEQG
jgi:hypothetical protein